MSNPTFRFGRVTGQSIDWRLKRNCSVTPAQLGWSFLALCVVSLAIGTWFWAMGARFVLGFAWIELMAVGLTFFVYARHAGDGETISLQGGRLVVETDLAGRHQRAEFRREWVRVEPRAGDTSLIEVSGQGRSVKVGRYVRPELRQALAHEIRKALRQA